MRILFTTFYDPAYLGIRYLASLMLQQGHEVRIVQLKSFRSKLLSPNDINSHTGYYIYYKQAFSASGDREYPVTPIELELFEDTIREWQPDIAAYSLRSPYNHLLPQILPVMRRAAPDAFLLGGGFGPTFNPEISLELGADAVIRGEGEGALLDLAEALAKGNDWRAIKNLAWLDSSGKVVQNPLRPLIRDLDSQPLPLVWGDHFVSIEDDVRAYDDMRLRTSEGIFCQSYVILTGRGCIGHCSYCAGGNWRNQYKMEGLKAPLLRTRSLKNVMEELRIAKARGEKSIAFVDEYLVRPYEELCAFLEDYAKEIDLPFYAHFHHRQLLEERQGKKKLLEIARKAGLTEIPVGVQSGSEAFASRVYYRQNNNAGLVEAINCFQRHGFSGNYHIIGGNPLETEADLEELFEFCARVPFDPSLKTTWSLLGMKLKLLDGSPLMAEHPELKAQTYDTAKFTEIMLLADLRNKVDARTFAAIRASDFYRGKPERLQFLLTQVIRDRHMAYLANEIERLKDKRVYFWGRGEMYQYKAHLFSACKPICFLDDTIPEDSTGLCQESLPVLHPAKGLDDNLPVVVFSAAADKISRKIQDRYPEYTDVVTCALL